MVTPAYTFPLTRSSQIRGLAEDNWVLRLPPIVTM